MWLLLLATFVANNPTLDLARADEPAISTALPAAPTLSEADLLWSQAELSFKAGNLTEATPLLQDLIHRFPTHPAAIDARYYLALTLLAANQPKKAIPLLRTFIGARSRAIDGLTARLAIGRAYLETQHGQEALLSAEEILHAKKNLTGELRVRGLQLKTRALLLLGHSARARTAAQSATTEFKRLNSSDLHLGAEVTLLNLDVKLEKCGALPGKSALTEAQTRAEADRRGTCLLEALPIFREILDLKNPPLAVTAAQNLANAYGYYREFCETPPAPPERRTSTQLVAYRQELAQALLLAYRANASQSQEFFKSWKLSTPSEMEEALQLATERVSL